MIELTTEEQNQVARYAKTETSLPTYFNAATQQNTPISRDFETYLILAPTGLKDSAIKWINTVTNLSKTNKNRDDLRKLVLKQALVNTQLRLSSYEATIGEFDDFRTNFSTDTRFASIPEVRAFIEDLQSVIDEQVSGQQAAFFDDTLAKLSQYKVDTDGLTEARLEQLQSWVPVLSSYLMGTAG